MGVTGLLEVGATVGSRLKVFFSYSRRDIDFADHLVEVPEWQGSVAVIDRKGIHGAERWEERLGQLILEADIVDFVLSPDSMTVSRPLCYHSPNSAELAFQSRR